MEQSSSFFLAVSIAILLLLTALIRLSSLSEEMDGEAFVDFRDDKEYKFVKIGGQAWMAENLNYEAEGSLCYDNDDSYCDAYGRLYNWEAAMKACPKGWHLPSGEEWAALGMFAGGEAAGKKLKAKSGWYNGGNGNDAYGFAALPGGFGFESGYFGNAGDNGSWWTSVVSGINNAYIVNMSFASNDIRWESNFRRDFFSVRCARD